MFATNYSLKRFPSPCAPEDVKLLFDAGTRDSCSSLSHLENSSNLFIKKEIRLELGQNFLMTSPPPDSVNPPNAPGYPPHPDQAGRTTVPQNGTDDAQTSRGSNHPPPYPPPHGHSPPVPQPIVKQPVSASISGQVSATDGWMVAPSEKPVDCPPGLEYLAALDHLFVDQKVEMVEVLTGFEMNNKYLIRNNEGDKMYYAIEVTDAFYNCCGNLRSFVIKIIDSSKVEVMSVERDLRCDSCLSPCCLQELRVYAPPGRLVGTVQQIWRAMTPVFDIKNKAGRPVLRIVGPPCQYERCGQINFEILSNNRSDVIGMISKYWSGTAREVFTDADIFGISFPIDLNVGMKAVILGACFLIDFMYFETTNQNAYGYRRGYGRFGRYDRYPGAMNPMGMGMGMDF